MRIIPFHIKCKFLLLLLCRNGHHGCLKTAVYVSIGIEGIVHITMAPIRNLTPVARTFVRLLSQKCVKRDKLSFSHGLIQNLWNMSGKYETIANVLDTFGTDALFMWTAIFSCLFYSKLTRAINSVDEGIVV